MSRPILLIITYLLLTTSAECPDKCRCSRYKTTCKGNIPRTYSYQTEELTITFAKITELTSRSFNSTELSNLIKLQISSSKVSNIQDDAFCELKQLRTLDLSRNKIRNITSQTFNCLEQLRVITLRSNKINQLGLGTFECLTSLRKLRLTYNLIYELSPGWYVKNNLISELGMEIGYSTFDLLEEKENGTENTKMDLELINLSYNYLRRLQPGTFLHLQTVKYLYLYNNNITNLSSGCFEGLYSVTLLDISRNSITALESGSFRGLRNLEYLLLSENKIKILRHYTFKFASNIRVINLLKNAITTIEKGAFWNLSKLRILNLKLNQVNKLGTPEETHVVSSNDLQNLFSLNNIELEDNETLRLGTEAFSKLYHLKILHLHYNAITKLSLGTFRDLYLLQTLWLSNNRISEIEGGSFIGLSKLKDLDLSYNYLTNLKNYTFEGLYLLEDLNLYYNKLQSLETDLFLGLTSLKDLSLGFNHFTSIPDGLFKDTIRLDVLRLQQNSELVLGPDSLQGLDTLRYLAFEINSYDTFSSLQAVKNVAFLHTANVEVFGIWSNFIELKRLDAHKLILDLNIMSPTLECDSFRSLENLKSLVLGSANISKIQKGAFKSLILITFLNLADNKISGLIPGTFEGLLSLRLLVLTKNLITKLDRAVFSVSDLSCVQDDERNLRRICHTKENWVHEKRCVQSKLLKLLLYNNKIQYIHPHAFLGSEQLQELYLSDNLMLTLEEKFFFLPSLQIMHLANCNVSDVSVYTFECAPNLIEVDLQSNYLRNLDIDVVKNLKNLGSFSVSRDKLDCSCANIETLIWMKNHGIGNCKKNCSVCTGLPRFRSLEHLYQYLNCSPPVEISELSRSTSLNLDMFKRYIEPSILSIIFLTGLVGNGLLLYIFVSRPDMRSGANACILNLALGDFLSLVVNLPLSYWDNQNDKWQLGLATCKLFMGVKDLTVGVTVFSVVALSVQRHSVTVQAVHTSTSSTRGILLTILVVWGLSVGFALPAFFTATVDTRCLYSAAVDHYVRLTWTMQLFIYCVVPVVIIVIRYVQVARHLRQSVANMPGETVAARQARGRSRVANMVIVLTSVFCLSYIPNFLLRVLCVWSMFDPESQLIFFLSFVSFCLFFCNSCFNPIALFCTSSRFRVALIDVIHLRGTKARRPSGSRVTSEMTTSDFRLSLK